MESMQREQAQELETLNWSILFLLLLIAGVLLSFSATADQRSSLAGALYCGREDTVDGFPKRWIASLLIVGTTGFFAWLACRAVRQTRERGDCAEQRSAHANLIAAVLVFVAALIRLTDLKLVARDRQSAARGEAPKLPQ